MTGRDPIGALRDLLEDATSQPGGALAEILGRGGRVIAASENRQPAHLPALASVHCLGVTGIGADLLAALRDWRAQAERIAAPRFAAAACDLAPVMAVPA